MDSPTVSPWKRCEKWARLITLVHLAGKEICYKLLFIERKLPTNGELLYEFLMKNDTRIKPEGKEKLVLYPKNGNTDMNEFDIPLYTKIIQGLYGSHYSDLIKDLRALRNKFFHKGNVELTEKEFKDLWEETSKKLELHGFDMHSLAELKECNIDQHQEYDKPLRNCMERFIQGNKEWFVFFICLSYLSRCLTFRNFQGDFFQGKC